MKKTLLAAAFALACTSAQASDGDAVASFGLIGSWAMDCAQPASPTNAYLVYSITGTGAVTEQLSRGGAAPERTSTMSNVQLITPAWLLYSLTGVDGSVVDVLRFKKGTKMRSHWSVGQGGKAFIIDGKFVANGAASPPLTKCESAPPM